MTSIDRLMRLLHAFFDRDANQAPVIAAEMGMYGNELDLQSAHLQDAIAQINVNTAGGRWLDIWGGIFGIPRTSGEIDGSYRQKLPAEVLAHRVNNMALSELIYKATAVQAHIEDTGNKGFKVSLYNGTLTNDQKRAIRDIIMRNKASGSIPSFWAPTVGTLIANDTATPPSTMNSIQYVIGPAASAGAGSWIDITDEIFNLAG